MNYQHSTVDGTVTGMARAENTASGNPRWRVETTAGTWHTEPDAAIAHALDDDLVGEEVQLRLRRQRPDGLARIVGVEVRPNDDTHEAALMVSNDYGAYMATRGASVEELQEVLQGYAEAWGINMDEVDVEWVHDHAVADE